MCAIFKISLEEISYAHQRGIYLIKNPANSITIQNTFLFKKFV